MIIPSIPSVQVASYASCLKPVAAERLEESCSRLGTASLSFLKGFPFSLTNLVLISVRDGLVLIDSWSNQI